MCMRSYVAAPVHPLIPNGTRNESRVLTHSQRDQAWHSILPVHWPRRLASPLHLPLAGLSTILPTSAHRRHAHGRGLLSCGDMRRLVGRRCAVDEHVWRRYRQPLGRRIRALSRSSASSTLTSSKQIFCHGRRIGPSGAERQHLMSFPSRR